MNSPTLHRPRFPQRSKRPLLRLPPEEFRQVVEAALDSLPPELAAYLDNIFVVVEEEPPPEVLKDMGMEKGGEILGLYRGVPLTERSVFHDTIPDRIDIYSGPIRRICRTRREAFDEIRKTVYHEIGHHFGIEEEDMPY